MATVQVAGLTFDAAAWYWYVSQVGEAEALRSAVSGAAILREEA